MQQTDQVYLIYQQPKASAVLETMYWQEKKGKQVHTSITTISETNLKLPEKPGRLFSWAATVHHSLDKHFATTDYILKDIIP